MRCVDQLGINKKVKVQVQCKITNNKIKLYKEEPWEWSFQR